MKTCAMTLMMVLTLAAACSSTDDDRSTDGSTTKEAGADKDLSSDDATADKSTTDASSVSDKSVPDAVAPDTTPDTASFPQTWVGAACTEAGASCTDESDEDFCVIGGYWVWQGGYCTKSCNPDDESSCPEGTHCSEFNEDGPNPTYCIKNCKDKSECRVAEGYVCDKLPGADWGGCIWFQ